MGPAPDDACSGSARVQAASTSTTTSDLYNYMGPRSRHHSVWYYQLGGQGSVQRCQPATTQKAISEDFALPFLNVEPVITNLSGGRA